MLEIIICYLIAKLKPTNYFETLFPLAELIRTSGKSDAFRPVVYLANGQAKDISVYDHFNGVCYFRETGKETSEEINKGNCRTELQIQHPLRLVGCVPKSKLTKDDNYSDDRIANSLRKVLTENGGLLKNYLKANSLSISVSSISKNHREILSEEYPGTEFKDINLNYSLVAIDFNVTVAIYADCIESECNINVSDFEFPANQTLCEAVEGCSIIETILEALASFSGLVIGEAPTGLVDGTNKIFTTANNYQSGKIAVYRNGQRLTLNSDYTETAANSYELVAAPFVGDIITNDYLKA